jgi:hypothetical protein
MVRERPAAQAAELLDVSLITVTEAPTVSHAWHARDD